VKLQGAAYYNVFAMLCIGCVVVYVFVAKAYKEKSYLQTNTPETVIGAENATAT
jgi:POT family proton-dependent oligopeptide transporter